MTLLEIMIVIFIIGIIGSVVGYNMKGSLEKGRAFKTEHGMRQAEEILMLEVANGNVELKDLKNNIEKAREVLTNSELARKPDDMLKDGWGKEYKIKVEQDEVRLYSENYQKYQEKQKSKK